MSEKEFKICASETILYEIKNTATTEEEAIKKLWETIPDFDKHVAGYDQFQVDGVHLIEDNNCKAEHGYLGRCEGDLKDWNNYLTDYNSADEQEIYGVNPLHYEK